MASETPRPSPTPAKRKPARDPDHVYICMGRHLEWPVAVWEQFQRCEIVGTKFKVPRALFDSVKDRHVAPE